MRRPGVGHAAGMVVAGATRPLSVRLAIHRGTGKGFFADEPVGAGDRQGAITEQAGDHFTDLLRFNHPFNRDVAVLIGHGCGGIRRGGQVVLPNLRVDQSRRHGIDPNALRRQFDGNGFAQAADAPLGCIIRTNAGEDSDISVDTDREEHRFLLIIMLCFLRSV